MPDPNLPTIQADPPSLLTWLDTNLLMAGTLQNVVNGSGLNWVTITADAPAYPGHVLPTADDGAGNAVDIYRLRSNGGGAHNAVAANICNYTAGQVQGADVSNNADFMFTTNLNGCTFAIGPAAPNGTRHVCHANTGGNSIFQRQQVRQEMQSGDLAGITLLEPSVYRSISPEMSMQATVFGIRSGLNWNFYFQSYGRRPDGTFRLMGVFPI